MLQLWTVLAMATVLAGTAQGQTLMAGYANGGSPFSYGNAFEMSAFEEAQAFQSTTDFTASSAMMWTTFQNGQTGLPNNGFQGVFEWAIYSGDTQPGDVLYQGTSVPTLLQRNDMGPGFDVSQWEFSLPDLALAGNTQYWMGLRNTDEQGSVTQTNFYWLANFSGAGPASEGRRVDGEWFENPALDEANVGYGNRLTLGIYGDPITTTPEPASAGLLGVGLAGMVPLVRRRRVDNGT
jgi:hypothetical protein